jgi:hypothetical protein
MIAAEGSSLGVAWPGYFDWPLPCLEQCEDAMFSVNFPTDPIDFGPITVQPPGDITLGGPTGSERSLRDAAVATVNRYEPYFRANADDYRAGRVSLAGAQARFDQLWAAMVAELRRLGAEGERAIRDRQAGGKFDWFAAYRPSGAGAAPGGPIQMGPGIVWPTQQSNVMSWLLLGGAILVLLRLLRVL